MTERSPHPSDHVDDETFVRLACNELNAGEVAVVMDHLERCEDCRQVWRAVETVREAAVEFDPGAVPPVDARFVRPPRPARRWLGLAAAAVLAASLLLLAKWPRQSEPPAPPASVVRSIPEEVPVALEPAEGSRVRNPTFSWRGVEGATGYSVDLLDDEGELIWQSERLTGLSVGWPSSVELEPGRYFWRVSAYFGDGEEPAASPLVSFELSAEPTAR